MSVLHDAQEGAAGGGGKSLAFVDFLMCAARRSLPDDANAAQMQPPALLALCQR